MSAFSSGIRPLNATYPPQASGELVATTPLGRDENGKNLVAYIVRTEDEAPQFRAPQQANTNDPRARLQDAPQRKAGQKNNEPPARFIRPDNLLSREHKAEVDHLRARDTAIREQAGELTDGDGESLLTSFVYATGPDGKRYVLGVGAPLRAFTQSDEEKARRQPKKADGEAVQLPLEGPENVRVRAAIAYRTTSYNDAAGARAGLIDNAI